MVECEAKEADINLLCWYIEAKIPGGWEQLRRDAPAALCLLEVRVGRFASCEKLASQYFHSPSWSIIA